MRHCERSLGRSTYLGGSAKLERKEERCLDCETISLLCVSQSNTYSMCRVDWSPSMDSQQDLYKRVGKVEN